MALVVAGSGWGVDCWNGVVVVVVVVGAGKGGGPWWVPWRNVQQYDSLNLQTGLQYVAYIGWRPSYVLESVTVGASYC